MSGPDEVRKRIMHWHSRYHVSRHTDAKNLDLSNLYLSDLPNEALRLFQSTPLNQEIEFLSLSFNDFQRVPVEVGGLVNLREIKLDNNKLKTLPHSFTNMLALQIVTLGYNAFTAFPSGM